jgi:hypothetical protein
MKCVHAISGSRMPAMKLSIPPLPSGLRLSSETALNVAISGSIFAVPDACLVIKKALAEGTPLAFPQDQAMSG